MLASSLFKRVVNYQRGLMYSSKFYYNDSDDSFFRQNFFKRSYTKPFSVSGKEALMTINCVKGRFKQQQDYIALDKVGVIILDFIPLKSDAEGQRQTLDARGKKNFSLNMQAVGKLLKYNPYNLKDTGLKMELQYFAGSQNEQKKLLIEKSPKQDTIDFKLQTEKAGAQTSFTIPVDLGDFIIIQELLRYSLPYMIGWHIMGSPRIAEEEFNSNPGDKFESYN